MLIRTYKKQNGEKAKVGIKDLDLVSNKADCPVNLIISTISGEPYGSSKEKSIVLMVSQ